jgi:hypothetical protein
MLTMKKIENDVGAFDFAALDKEHKLGSTTVEAHVPHCDDLIRWAKGSKFATIIADRPWRFQNSTGKVAPSINV